nr:MAG TPA: hypothetical protein [Microviridae sp.]
MRERMVSCSCRMALVVFLRKILRLCAKICCVVLRLGFACILITSAILFLGIGVLPALQRMKSSVVMIALFRLFFGLLFSKSIEVIHLFNYNKFIMLCYGYDVFNPPQKQEVERESFARFAYYSCAG